MTLQWVGPVLAGTTFITIGIGHVLVRRLHARFGTRPAAPLFALGALVMLFSLFAVSDLLSAVLGISGMTVIWDGVEIFRQEKRAQREMAAHQPLEPHPSPGQPHKKRA